MDTKDNYMYMYMYRTIFFTRFLTVYYESTIIDSTIDSKIHHVNEKFTFLLFYWLIVIIFCDLLSICNEHLFLFS